jgi:glutamate synthase domain-containing protein 1
MKFKYPEKQGLYDPQFEHDNCGVGFVVQIKNRNSHQIVMLKLGIVKSLLFRIFKLHEK